MRSDALIVVPHGEATENIKTNKTAFWSSTVGRVHHGRASIQLKRQVLIRAGEAVWALGSCFAAEVQKGMARRNFPVVSAPVEPLQDWGLFRYNTPSMLLEFKRCLDPDFTMADTDLVVQTDDGKLRDCHFAAMFPHDSMETLVRHRALARDIFQRISEAKLVVITLGLNEMFYDPDSGAYLNTWSDMNLVRKKPNLQVRVLSTQENVDNLEKIHALITKHARPDVQVVVTVSPVALYATFTDDDVVVANTRSKIILRAAAEEFSLRHLNVYYFPSWEIAMNSEYSTVFDPDGRHVQEAMVDHIVGLFCESHVG